MRWTRLRFRLAELLAGDQGMDAAILYAYRRGVEAGRKAAAGDARLLADIHDTPAATLAQQRRLRLVRDGGE